jgi:hypothetical protein
LQAKNPPRLEARRKEDQNSEDHSGFVPTMPTQIRATTNEPD